MLGALRDGLAAARRNWGLPLLLLGVNLGSAATLALPLASSLKDALEARDAASHMLYGFDHAWWSRWSEEQAGWPRHFGPEIFGQGFAFRNIELLLRGQLPLGLFDRDVRAEDDDDATGEPDGVILALGALYLLVQTFLLGGVLGVMRTPQGGWTVRGLLHGAGFYFGRLLRVTLVTLAVAWLVFRLYAPLARWADHMAMEAVSEATALAWSFSRHLLLLLGLLAVSMVSSYAKVIMVVEERSSALLAWLSALAFCAGRFRKAFGHYLAVAALGMLLLVLWTLLDGAWTTTGYKTQLVTMLLMQGLVYGRIYLRVSLLGGMVALYQAEAR
jgi:hypothetical protein